MDHLAVGEDHGALEDVLQLPYVAEEVVLAEQLERLRREADDPVPHLGAQAFEDPRGEDGDILPSLPERRDDDAHHVEAIEEILAERSALHPLLEVLVRRGDDPGVDGHRRRPPEAGDAFLLQHAQDLHLEGERHIADLIEKERASARQFEHPGLSAHRTGEGALLVAEELALQEVFRHPADVDGDEWAAALGARAVDLPGDDLLAGTALPGDEDDGGGVADPVDDLLDPLDGGALPDEDRSPIVSSEPALALHHVAQLLGIDELLEADDQLLGVERLDDVVLCTLLEGGDGVVDLPVGADHDDRHPEALAADPGDERQAVHARHLQVYEAGVVVVLAEHPLGGEPVLGAVAVDAVQAEVAVHQFTDIGFIVDDQNFHGVSFAPFFTGWMLRLSVTSATVPPPSRR